MNTLITVHKNGIVNQFQISNTINDANTGQENKNQEQVIWNGEFKAITFGVNEEPSELKGEIKDFRAIYLDGVLIVKNGNVYPDLTIYQKIKKAIKNFLIIKEG